MGFSNEGNKQSRTCDPGGVEPLDGHLLLRPVRFPIFVFALFSSAEKLALAVAGSRLAQELGDARKFGLRQSGQEGKVGRIRLRCFT